MSRGEPGEVPKLAHRFEEGGDDLGGDTWAQAIGGGGVAGCGYDPAAGRDRPLAWDLADPADLVVLGDLGGDFNDPLAIARGRIAGGAMDASRIDRAAVQAIQHVKALVEALNLRQGISNALDAKLEAVEEALEAANAGLRADAVNRLEAFIAHVEAQRGKAITDAQADALIAWACRIQGVL